MDWPLSQGRITAGALVQLTASGSTHTKGAWTELNTIDSDGCCIGMFGTDRTRFLIDLGVGAAGSEVVIVPNIHFSIYTAQTGGQMAEETDQFWLPLHVPRGLRVAARCQSDVASAQLVLCQIPAVRVQPTRPGLSAWESFGADTANTRGTSVVNGSSGTPTGSWTQLIASTARTYRWITVWASGYGTIVNDSAVDVQLGVGGAGSEVVLTDFVRLFRSANALMDAVSVTGYSGPIHIPKGSRVSARGVWAGGGDNQTFYVCGIGGG